MSGPALSTTSAVITDADAGGFRAIASTTDLDRDGEIIDYRAFEPLPASIPVHADHVASVATLVARAVPSYRNGKLWIDATFASTPTAQEVRQKVLDGVLDTVSVAFFNAKKKVVDGVTHITHGELLSVDLVTIPSNRGARVMSARSFGPTAREQIAQARGAALLALVEAELADARRALKAARSAEAASIRADVRTFLRSL